MRIIIGLPFVLLFPGFTFISALYPRRSSMDRVERLVLSMALSVSVVPLLLLVLNFTPWQIHITSTLVTITAFIVICAGIALFRQRRLPEQERPVTEIKFPAFPQQTAEERILSVVLVIAILAAAGGVWYTLTRPKTPDKFTEFYILGRDNKVENYPSDIRLGSSGTVTLGIINHENSAAVYRVEVITAGVPDRTVPPVTLQPEAKCETPVSFKPKAVGDHQEVRFLLYKNGESAVYLELHLWVNVIP